ncbi:MAG: TonB-dependent receptor [Chitinophagaceae bacterium]
MGKKTLSLLCLSLFISLITIAQTGKLAGKILNAKNEPLPGVSIKIVGANGGATTDQGGQYTITLPAGKKYDLDFTAVGYSLKAISEVEIKEDKVTTLDIVMEVAGKNLAGVTVTATRSNARKETVNSLIQFQKNTNTVAAVVSAEAIRRSPDKNTGEVLKRIPGTSIQEGKYLVVRGLSDRYNVAMLNGIQLSSTEPDRKAFSFDIIPSSMIDNIIINKAFVPEYPGEWAGGLIQVNTKDIPSSNFFNVSVGTGFNSQTLGKKFYTYDGGKYDWLGFDDGTRGLPGGTPAKKSFGDLSDVDKIAIGKKIANPNGVKEAGIPLNQSLQASGGFNTSLLGKKFGAVIGLTYNRTARRNQFENNIWNINRGSANFQPSFLYSNNKYTQDVLAGALANFSLQLNNDNKISFRNILNVNTSNYTTLRTGKDYEFNPNEGENIRAQELGFRANTFFNTQLNGEHSIKIGEAVKTKLDWYGSFTILDQYIPQQRRIQYNQDPGSDANPYTLLIGSTLSQKTGSVFYSTLSDYIYNAGANLTTPFTLFNNKQTVKAGYLFRVKDRLYNSRPFSVTLPSDNASLRLLPADQVFAPGNFSDGTQDNKFFFDEYTEDRFRYMANTILNAGFIQFDNQFADWLRVVWGARYEHFDQLVGSVKKSDPRFVNSVKGDLLPSLNINFKLNNQTNLRLSGSQTVVRPEFRELSPLAFYDFELGASVVGNQSLVRTKITNADLRYELYPRAGEMVTLGVFYKHFSNPIEQYFNQSGAGSSSTFNFINVEKATSYGIEFEFRKKLDFAQALRNFTFQTNLAYIYNRITDPLVKIDRPMQGQSPYVINAALQYDIEKFGLNTTLLFNEIGRRILYVGNDAVPEIWEAPRPLFDFQVAKKLYKNRAEIRLNISDIFNQRANFYHDINENGKYNKATDALAISRLYGTNVNISFGYTFK